MDYHQTPKLTIKIQDPAMGKGWYIVRTPPGAEGLSHNIIRMQIQADYPDATGVQIIWEYKV